MKGYSFRHRSSSSDVIFRSCLSNERHVTQRKRNAVENDATSNIGGHKSAGSERTVRSARINNESRRFVDGGNVDSTLIDARRTFSLADLNGENRRSNPTNSKFHRTGAGGVGLDGTIQRFSGETLKQRPIDRFSLLPFFSRAAKNNVKSCE